MTTAKPKTQKNKPTQEKMLSKTDLIMTHK